ncbi:MAG: tail fiber domain-containing protein [Pyrinomonadaceae bacterium]
MPRIYLTARRGPAARAVSIAMFIVCAAVWASGQTTKFVYQGSLSVGGAPANGNFEMQFKLFDAAVGGTQQGSTQTANPVAVTNGSFAVTLDFGAAVFGGADRYLEIATRQIGAGTLTTLSPRTQILSSPFAIRSASASAADSATTAANASQLGGIAPSGYIQNTLSQQSAANISISGSALFGGSVGVGTVSPTAKLHVVGTQPPVSPNGNGTDAASVLAVAGGSGGNTNGSNVNDTGGVGGGISIRGGDGGQNPANASRDGGGGSITLQGGLARAPAANGSVNLAPDGGNVIVAGANNIGRVGVGTTAPTARLNVVDPRTGSATPDFNNLPPTAILGRTTSTAESTVGVMGIAHSSTGIGLVGVTYGDGTTVGESDAIGLLAAALSPTGNTIGASIEVLSPTGTTLDLHLATTGNFIVAKSDDNAGSNPRFRVSSIGQVIAQGGMWAKGFHLNSDNMHILENGNVDTVGAVSAASLTTTGNASIGGTLSAPGGTLNIASNLSINGTVTPLLLSGGNNTLCNLSGTTTLRFCTSSLRYKRDVRGYAGGLGIVMRLRPISFEWKENGSKDVGLGAEDVAEVAPELTFKNDDGEIEGVRYNQLAAVLVNAIKQQQETIDRQQKQIDALTRAVTRLQRPVQRKRR